ncbi:MAG: AAA family ATPase [Flavobacterium sp.]
MKRYNYPEIIKWLEQKGKELYGNNFKIFEEDFPIITSLLVYFLKDEITAKTIDIDLDKGLLISGPIGCGKTTIMNLMRYVPEQKNKYILKPTREISFEFIKEGYEVIQRYTSGNTMQNSVKNYCFDDLGTEKNLKYFGNECNVMGEILLSRYDLFVNKKIITHLTTNLSASEIEAAYGNRVRSRLRQLCNLVAFNKDSQDKRK